MNDTLKYKLLVILGPTATGKSKLGIALSGKLNGQIISGDAFLVYKGMDIGTAKPTAQELSAATHHLVNILSPKDAYSAAAFQEQAALLIRRLNETGVLPILVGGTGLYIKALLEGYDFGSGAKDAPLRRELSYFAENFGDEALYARLQKASPDSAALMHPHNRQRVIRALEAAGQGSGISRRKQPGVIYDAKIFGLTMPRAALYERINNRVKKMFADGLTLEVENLLRRGVPRDAAALRAIGYKEVVGFLDKEYSLQHCEQLVAQNTRRFAKRQFTWYKKMPYINWLDAGADDLTDNICGRLVGWHNLR